MPSNPDTIRISGLAKSTMTALRRSAKLLGLNVDDYAKRLVEEGLERYERARVRSLDELLSPLRAQFAASGMTEQELDELVDAARRKHHRRQSRKKKRRLH